MRWYVGSSGAFHSPQLGRILGDLASPYVKGMSPNCKTFLAASPGCAEGLIRRYFQGETCLLSALMDYRVS